MDRDRTLALLRDQHEFPGPFRFRVVLLDPTVRGTVLSAMVAASGEGSVVEDVTERPSRTGKYLSLRVLFRLQTAEQVLDVYAVLQEMEGVGAVL